MSMNTMKRLTGGAAAAALLLSLLGGCAQTADTAAAADSDTDSAAASDALDILTDMATTQYFTDEAVPEADVETILTAGVNAPSAMNGQPWHFTAVTDAAVLQQIADDMSSGMPTAAASSGDTADSETAAPAKAGIADAPLAIIVSCADGSELDAGLACQAMSSAAQVMGYGTKIISSPTIALNGDKQEEYRALLGIPEGYAAAAVLLVGYEDTSIDETLDGYTGATERNPLDDMVTYVTEDAAA